MHHCLARPLPSPIAARQHPLAWLACVCLLLPAAAVRADDAAPGRLEEIEEAYVATPNIAPVTQGFASLELSDPDVILAQKIQDPAIETVDEMTRRGAAGGSTSGGNVGQW